MIWSLLLMAGLAFVQNMAFTWSSRSRNSGDPAYHRWAAAASNGIWFVTNGLLFSILKPIMDGTAGWYWLIAAALLYVVATTEGSVYMMRRLMKKETGKRKVGA